MGNVETGMLVKSIAGHDKGQIYVIVQIDETYLYLADGKSKTLAHPKRKKEKHVQVLCSKHSLDGVDDVKLKRIIKVFGNEMRGE